MKRLLIASVMWRYVGLLYVYDGSNRYKLNCGDCIIYFDVPYYYKRSLLEKSGIEKVQSYVYFVYY